MARRTSTDSERSREGLALPLEAFSDRARTEGLSTFKEPELDLETSPDWFHEGQRRAWNSKARTVAVIAGAQSGKTVLGPWWLIREMQRCGPGDYAIVGPTITLIERKAIPEFAEVFCRTLGLGTYRSTDHRFVLSEEGAMKLFGKPDASLTVFIGYATKPDSLESATYKAIWADEAGQSDFQRGSWEALDRRRLVHQARALITTTPYSWNWLKTDLLDRAETLGTDIEVINFATTANPRVNPAEVERARRVLPDWRFAMMYEGKFTRPAGMVYADFRRDTHTVPRFEIPQDWQRFMGVDFGSRNTAAVWVALDPQNGIHYVTRTYHDAGQSPQDHVRRWRHDEPEPLRVGGAPSEGDWREGFAEAGAPIQRPAIAAPEVQIARVRALFAERKLLIFDDLERLIRELESLSYCVNSDGDPLPEIERESTFHRHAALRYACTLLALGEEAKKIERAHRFPPGKKA
ncbi:MAG: terminase family protein [Armatimonadetes bacterium]|nr:terminase family protein [Armatimonadota bacterium]